MPPQVSAFMPPMPPSDGGGPVEPARFFPEERLTTYATTPNVTDKNALAKAGLVVSYVFVGSSALMVVFFLAMMTTAGTVR